MLLFSYHVPTLCTFSAINGDAQLCYLRRTPGSTLCASMFSRILVSYVSLRNFRSCNLGIML